MAGVSRKAWLAAAAIALAAALASPPAAEAQGPVIWAGVNVRMLSGTFGSDQTTRIVYAPVVVRADFRRFELSGQFPYLTIASSTVVPSQGGFVPMQGSLSHAPGAGMSMMGGGMMGPAGPPVSGGVPGLVTNQAGFGDIFCTVGFRVVDNWLSGLQLLVDARVKIPTAAATRGLGTGLTDVAGAVVLRKQFFKGWVYAEGGYLVPGTSAEIDLKNAVFWGAGGGVGVTPRLYLLASAYGSSAIVPQFGAPVELGAGLGVRVGDRIIVTVLPTVGLSDASANYSVVFGIGSDLWRR